MKKFCNSILFQIEWWREVGSKPNISQPTARVKTRTYEVPICDLSNRSTKGFKLKKLLERNYEVR